MIGARGGVNSSPNRAAIFLPSSETTSVYRIVVRGVGNDPAVDSLQAQRLTRLSTFIARLSRSQGQGDDGASCLILHIDSCYPDS